MEIEADGAEDAVNHTGDVRKDKPVDKCSQLDIGMCLCRVESNICVTCTFGNANILYFQYFCKQN